MKPKLLIVTTFYNENERLKFTLENMLLQQSDDFVHLLIDDGSTKKDSDLIVREYISRSNHSVIYEEHANVGINEVHMRAFRRTEEFGCTHFMWLDCGDGLKENAVSIINGIISKTPETWLHLDGYYVSDKDRKKVKMSSKSDLTYLKKEDQFLPFCLGVSTYGHYIIPYKTYSRFNPNFQLVDGFYYDAQIIGTLSLNHCLQYFIQTPLSLIQDDMHFSVANPSGNSYRDNVLELSKFVVADEKERIHIADISDGMNLISIRRLFRERNYFKNRAEAIRLKKFYKENGIRVRDRYKWRTLLIISLFYLC